MFYRAGWGKDSILVLGFTSEGSGCALVATGTVSTWQWSHQLQDMLCFEFNDLFITN